MRNLFIIITFVSLIFVQTAIHGMPGETHVRDMRFVLEDIDVSNPEVRNFLKNFTSNLIDDMGKQRFLTRLPVAPDGKKIDHRSIFHWGWSDKIPFDRDGPLKKYLNKFPPKERKKIKEQIRKEWQKRVNSATDELIHALKWSPTNRNQARAVAGILYDTHLLGDWSTHLVDSLQDVDHVGQDIIKNLKKLYGKNDPLVKEIEKKINLIVKNAKLSQKQKAAKLLEVLKVSPIGERFNRLSGNIQKRLSVPGKATQKALRLTALMSKKFNQLTQSLSPAAQSSLTGAGLTAVVSGLSNSWAVYKNEKEFSEAFASVITDSSLSGTSIYLSEGIIQHVGNGKYAITALVEGGASTAQQAIGAFLNYGVATFIFDSTRNVFHYAQGKISRKQFFRETGHAAVKSAAAGSLSYAVVTIAKTSAGNPFVIAASIGGYLIASKAIEAYEKMDERNYFFAEDVLGVLPLKMQKRITAFNSNEWRLFPSAFDKRFKLAPSAIDENFKLTPSAFDNKMRLTPSAFDFD